MYQISNKYILKLVAAKNIEKSLVLGSCRHMGMARPVEPGINNSEIDTRDNKKLAQWQKVRWKNKNIQEKIIHSMAQDDTKRSDPEDARRISDLKMNALRTSLVSRGFVSESFDHC